MVVEHKFWHFWNRGEISHLMVYVEILRPLWLKKLRYDDVAKLKEKKFLDQKSAFSSFKNAFMFQFQC